MKLLIKIIVPMLVFLGLGMYVAYKDNKDLIDQLNTKRDNLTSILSKYDFNLDDLSKQYNYYNYRNYGNLEYVNNNHCGFKVYSAKTIVYYAFITNDKEIMKEQIKLYIDVINEYGNFNINASDYYDEIINAIYKSLAKENRYEYEYVDILGKEYHQLSVEAEKDDIYNTDIRLVFGLDIY